jgi:hypothetical protein
MSEERKPEERPGAVPADDPGENRPHANPARPEPRPGEHAKSPDEKVEADGEIEDRFEATDN